ncbi:MAG: hypothetical protein ABL951_03905 [Alphaproteobacteria bacterium]
MSGQFLNNIILANHAVAQLRPEEIFGEHSPLIAINQPENGRTASAGWVGENYTTGGTVFMGINPGGGKSAYIQPKPDDIVLYDLLRAFKNARGETELKQTFHRLSSGWIDLQAGHNIWRLLEGLLEAAGLEVQQTAFLNLVPFRTLDNKPPSRGSIIRAWNLATKKQIAVLQPTRIFLLGYKVADALARFSETLDGINLVRVKRTNGDRYISPQAEELMHTLRQRLQHGKRSGI